MVVSCMGGAGGAAAYAGKRTGAGGVECDACHQLPYPTPRCNAVAISAAVVGGQLSLLSSWFMLYA